MQAARVPWTTSGHSASYLRHRTVQARALSRTCFENPVEMVWSPALNKFAVLEVEGKIFTFNDDQRVSIAELMIDLEEALGADKAYGMVFHPNFNANRFIYLCYIEGRDTVDGTKVSRFKVRDTEPPTIDPASEKILITWKSGGHNGCSLQFGPDGYLYISTGDGTPPSPPDALNTGQDISDLLGAILRIDVDNTDGDKSYSVPADNPFVNLEGASPEVWAYGFRNPWRMSFDRKTGDLLGWRRRLGKDGDDLQGKAAATTAGVLPKEVNQ